MKKIKIIFFRIFSILILFHFLNCAVQTDQDEKEKKITEAPGVFSNKRLGGVFADAGIISVNADLNGDGDKNDENEILDSVCYGGYDILIVKFNSSGRFMWSKRLGGAENDFCYKIAIDNDNNIIAAGKIMGFADLNGDQDYMDGGVCLWSRRKGGSSGDLGKDAGVDSSGNIYVSGEVTGNADFNDDGFISATNAESAGALFGGNDICIIKMNSSRDPAGSVRIGSIADERNFSLAIDNNNNAVFDINTGGEIYYKQSVISVLLISSPDAVHGGKDNLTIKLTQALSFVRCIRLGGPQDDTNCSVAVDNNRNIFVTGNVLSYADLNGDSDTDDGIAESSTGFYPDIFISMFSE